MYFLDRQSTAGGNGNSLYFTDRGLAGGLIFDFGKPEVRDFLIQNAKFFLTEYKAEYWDVNPYIVKPVPEGAGFDTTLTDGLRIAIRDVISNASVPDERPLNMTGLAASLWPDGFPEEWRFVQGPENHDSVYVCREQRVARLGDPGNPR